MNARFLNKQLDYGPSPLNCLRIVGVLENKPNESKNSFQTVKIDCVQVKRALEYRYGMCFF